MNKLYINKKHWSSLHHKRLAASTLALAVGVVEDKPARELIVDPVHLRANNAKQRLGVNQHLDAVLYHLLVKLSRLVHILEVICQTRAASVLNSNANKFWLGLVQQLFQVRHCCRRQLNSSLSRPQLSARGSGRLGSLGGSRC